MKSVCVCGGCGRTIESEFVYCPWCGQTKIKNSKDSMKAMIRNLEEKQAEDRARRVALLERELDELEQDLSILVLSAEMAK